MAAKFTFQQFKAQYPDDDACLAAILERRYGKADACPQCGVIGKLTKIAGRRAYACKEGCHTYPCVGTIFEHSSTQLTLWFHAMYLMTATRNGVSAKELQRQLGVTYKCAWRIGHQLRLLMSARAIAQNPGPLNGHVELDETYIGGRIKGKGKGNYAKNKSIVFLAAAKDAGVKVSPNIKPPSVPRVEGKRTVRRRGADQDEYEEDEEEEMPLDPDMVRFELPIPGKRNAIVTVPNDLEADDWEMLTQMLDLYIKRLQKPAI